MVVQVIVGDVGKYRSSQLQSCDALLDNRVRAGFHKAVGTSSIYHFA